MVSLTQRYLVKTIVTNRIWENPYDGIHVLSARSQPFYASQVEFRVGDVVPVRPVAERRWLKSTGPLPLGYKPNYDARAPSDGGCDSPAHFDGCHVYYMKVF